MVEALIFSDAHYSLERILGDERWIELKKIKLGSLGRKENLKVWDDATQLALQKFLRRAKSMGHFDFLFNLGDATTGANQQGLIAPRAKKAQKKFNEMLESLGTSIFSLWGNHDTGFPDLVHKEFGGMSKESFNAAKDLIGDPYFSKTIEGFTLLFLNSEIIRSSEEKDNPDQIFFIQKTDEQEKFIHECLEKAKNTDKKVILLIHDPTQIKHLRKVLKPFKKNIVLVLAGHLHAPIAWKIYCLLTGTIKTMQSFNVKVIPALWGKIPFSEGPIDRGGYATLTLNDGQFSLKRHKL